MTEALALLQSSRDAGNRMAKLVRPEIRLERRDDALWIWIDREERRNALDRAVLAGIEAAVRMAEADPTVRAMVLTGACEKAFCADADRDGGTADFGRLARVVRTAGVPLVARINGSCVAGGMGLMLLCDLAVAADHARFGLPEVKVGVFPMQVLAFLRASLQARHINELCLTGELISASRAAEIGLINEVAPPGALDVRIEILLGRIRAASPPAVRRGKQVIFAMEMMAFDEALAVA